MLTLEHPRRDTRNPPQCIKPVERPPASARADPAVSLGCQDDQRHKQDYKRGVPDEVQAQIAFRILEKIRECTQSDPTVADGIKDEDRRGVSGDLRVSGPSPQNL